MPFMVNTIKQKLLGFLDTAKPQLSVAMRKCYHG